MLPALLLLASLQPETLPRLLEDTAYLRSLPEAAIRRLVPTQSGLYFVGCPNCNAGHQERQLAWDPRQPDSVYCRHCRHRYPSAQYPMDRQLDVRGPDGTTSHYPYWQNPSGYRYFFAARRDDLARECLATQARQLALLYEATRHPAHARAAAVILLRFAEVFPSWCFHYDFPFRQKQIFEGFVPSSQSLPELRTARWSWWGYSDMPLPLLDAYEKIRPTLTAAECRLVEDNLFRPAAEQLAGYPETATNMSPRLWLGLVRAGRALGESRWIAEPLARVKAMLTQRFFYDGSWAEGAPSYARQTINELRRVAEAASFDPPQELLQAQRALDLLRLPDGRFVPLHDTWSTDRGDALPRSQPFLLPALGHAALAAGEGPAQWQAHLTWAGGYGHEHADRLSLLLYARKRELLSDLGYSHTKLRSWTLATAAHNTVVIDERNQEMKSADGTLEWFDTAHPRVQTVRASGLRAYPGLATTYRRTLIAAAGRYLVDVFEVAGGSTHDYFLHGDADLPGPVEIQGASTPIPTLTPWQETANENERHRIREANYAYGFLKDQRERAILKGDPVEARFPGSLTAILLPEPGDRFITGWNPAIRGAREDESLLPGGRRGFLRWRRNASASTFIAVFALSPGRLSAARTPKGLRVTWNGRAEDIELSPDGLRIAALQYELKPARSAPLLGISNGTVRVEGSIQPPPGTLLRLVTADGWIYPVNQPQDAVLRYDPPSKKLELLRFPQRAHTGPVRVEWREPSANPASAAAR